MATRTAEILRLPGIDGIGLFVSRLKGLRTPAQPISTVVYPIPFTVKDDRPKLPLITLEVQRRDNSYVKMLIDFHPKGTYNVEPDPEEAKPENKQTFPSPV